MCALGHSYEPTTWVLWQAGSWAIIVTSNEDFVCAGK